MIENVYVFPGCPAEMEAMFDAVADELRGRPPIASWRRTYRTRESDIVELLAEATERWPDVLVGCTRASTPTGPEVTVVLKSSDDGALDDAAAFVEPRSASELAARERLPLRQVGQVDELPVAPDVAVLAADHDQHELLVARRVRPPPRRRRLDVHEPAGGHLVRLVLDLEPRCPLCTK